MSDRYEYTPALWLVRHGESTWNVLGLVQGHADEATLTSQGLCQAALVAAQLKDRLVDAVYASDLRRAQQTANIVADAFDLPVQIRAELRERSFGVCEGGPQNSLAARVTGLRGGRVVDPRAHPAGGESLQDVYDRAGVFVDWLHEQHHRRDVIVVAHGGTIRAIRAYWDGQSMQDLVWDDVTNGSVWRLSMPEPVLTNHFSPTHVESGGIR
ncbi:MAG TPA: histidine phosphatase family protein [Acidimicrobiales bacterium]|nr:histidine phosphatase family protein [Acidimicrobiales bacterium]